MCWRDHCTLSHAEDDLKGEIILKNIFDEYGELIIAIIVVAALAWVVAMFAPHSSGTSFGKALLMDLEAAICGQ